jgi:hypothetical protein
MSSGARYVIRVSEALEALRDATAEIHTLGFVTPRTYGKVQKLVGRVTVQTNRRMA